jgi:hypothetical protein
MTHLGNLLKENERIVTILGAAAGKEINCLALTKMVKTKLAASLNPLGRLLWQQFVCE